MGGAEEVDLNAFLESVDRAERAIDRMLFVSASFSRGAEVGPGLRPDVAVNVEVEGENSPEARVPFV